MTDLFPVSFQLLKELALMFVLLALLFFALCSLGALFRAIRRLFRGRSADAKVALMRMKLGYDIPEPSKRSFDSRSRLD